MELIDAFQLDGLRQLAQVRDRLNDLIGLETIWRKIVSLVPDDTLAYGELGTSLLRQGRSEEALFEYSHALRIDPGNAGAHFGASIAHTRLGHFEEAIKAVRCAIQYRSDPQYHSQLGHLLARIGQRRDAIAAFERVLEVETGNVGVVRILRELLAQDGYLEAAAWYGRLATELEPNNVSDWIAQVRILGLSSRLNEAISTLETGLRSLPLESSLLVALASFHTRAGNMDDAIRFAQQAQEKNPASADIALELSRTLSRVGRFTEAEAALDLGLRIDPTRPELLEQESRLRRVRTGSELAAIPSHYLAISSENVVAAAEKFLPRCLIYTNFADLNPSFARYNLDSVYVDRMGRWRAVSLCRLPSSVQLVVPSDEDFIPICNAKALAEQVRPQWNAEDLLKATSQNFQEEGIEGPVVLIARWGVRTWGHWLGELLPKIVVIEAFAPGRFRYVLPDVLTRDAAHRTWLESLAFYGIDQSRIVWTSQRTTYTAHEMYVVTSVWSAVGLHPAVGDLMRRTTREVGARTRKVSLLRKSWKTRNIENIDSVERILQARGWETVEIERLPFHEQVEVFRNASAIVSVLGSGLTGLLYAQTGVKVATLAPSHWGDSFFFALMQDREAVLADVRGSSLAADQNDSDQVRNASFRVPLPETEIALTLLDLANGPKSQQKMRPRQTLAWSTSASAISPIWPFGVLSPLISKISSDVQRTIAQAPIVVSVQHEAAKIGDSLNVVPFILGLALRYARPVYVRGQFSDAVKPLLSGLPISFDEVGGAGPRIEYTVNVTASWNYSGPRSLHILQGYFALEDMPVPELPVSLPLVSHPTAFSPGIVVSPFCSQREDDHRHVRTWFVDRWHTVIEFLLSQDPTSQVYLVGGPGDDPTPFLRDGIIPVIGQPLTHVLDLMRKARLCVTIDTGTSHLAHFGLVCRHVLLYPAVNYYNICINPRAKIIHAWPKDIMAEQVIAACLETLERTDPSAAPTANVGA